MQSKSLYGKLYLFDECTLQSYMGPEDICSNTVCLVQGEVYKSSHFVFVRGQDTPEGATEEDKNFWVARILQIRAANSQHVYALVININIRQIAYKCNH